MKKIVSMIFVLVICLCFVGAAYAEGECFTVTYTGSGNFNVPNDKLSFTVEQGEGIPFTDEELIIIEDKQITNEVTEVPIEMPESYGVAGEYVYKIWQNGGSSPDFEYDSQPIEFRVLVGYDYDDNLTVLATGVGYSGPAKKVGFINKLKSGSLIVTNIVQGTEADRNDKEFDVNVTFTGQNVPAVINYSVQQAGGTEIPKTSEGPIGQTRTVTLHLKHGSTATFNDMPTGISYTITQDTLTGFSSPVIEFASGTLTAGQPISATVKNSASVSIGSGVLFENTGALIILSVAVVGLLLLLFRRKRKDH